MISKIIKAIFYFLGVFLVGAIVHETYHYSSCGGYFIAGLQYPQMVIETTFCDHVGNRDEIVPTILELSVWLLAIIVWRRK